MGHGLYGNQPHDLGVAGLSSGPTGAGLSRRVIMRSLMLAPAALVLAGSQRTTAVAATACVMDDSDGLVLICREDEDSQDLTGERCVDLIKELASHER